MRGQRSGGRRRARRARCGARRSWTTTPITASVSAAAASSSAQSDSVSGAVAETTNTTATGAVPGRSSPASTKVAGQPLTQSRDHAGGAGQPRPGHQHDVVAGDRRRRQVRVGRQHQRVDIGVAHPTASGTPPPRSHSRKRPADDVVGAPALQVATPVRASSAARRRHAAGARRGRRRGRPPSRQPRRPRSPPPSARRTAASSLRNCGRSSPRPAGGSAPGRQPAGDRGQHRVDTTGPAQQPPRHRRGRHRRAAPARRGRCRTGRAGSSSRSRIARASRCSPVDETVRRGQGRPARRSAPAAPPPWRRPARPRRVRPRRPGQASG